MDPGCPTFLSDALEWGLYALAGLFVRSQVRVFVQYDEPPWELVRISDGGVVFDEFVDPKSSLSLQSLEQPVSPLHLAHFACEQFDGVVSVHADLPFELWAP